MESASSIFWGLLIVAVLVLVNAFFVAAEYALVRVRRTRMEALAAQGSGLARVVLHGLDHLSRYIAGVQVGITLAGLASAHVNLCWQLFLTRFLCSSFLRRCWGQRHRSCEDWLSYHLLFACCA